MELLEYDSIVEKLRDKRRKLDLTQSEVAHKAEVNKATVSRMENKGTKNINYQTVYSIWSELNRREQQQKPTDVAEDIMSPDIEWVITDESARDARMLMYEYCFSQVPVRLPEEKNSVGTVTERSLMETQNMSKSVDEVMDAPLIEVRPKTTKEVIVNIFKDGEDAVLVRDPDGDAYSGIVTRADTF